jgi:hypothetical protein
MCCSTRCVFFRDRQNSLSPLFLFFLPGVTVCLIFDFPSLNPNFPAFCRQLAFKEPVSRDFLYVFFNNRSSLSSWLLHFSSFFRDIGKCRSFTILASGEWRPKLIFRVKATCWCFHNIHVVVVYANDKSVVGSTRDQFDPKFFFQLFKICPRIFS